MFGRKALVRRRDATASAPPPASATDEPGQFAAALIARADAARDAKRWRDAATLYDEALRVAPDNAGIQVQCGHMHKEAGELAGAEAHYLAAARLTPDDPDLALQLGHFYKIAGRVRDAAAAYRRAGTLKPGWAEPAAELDYLRLHGWRDAGTPPLLPGQATPDVLDTQERIARGFDKEASELQLAVEAGRLVPEIVPRKPHEMLIAHGESHSLRRFGKGERSFWGMLPTFRGVEAIRGFVISFDPVTELQIALNGLVIHRGPLRGGYELAYERDNKQDLLKYVFNVWLDFSGYAPGRYEVELRFLAGKREPRVHREYIVIAKPLLEADYPNLDSIITLDPSDTRPVQEQVNTRPSAVHPATRPILSPETLRNVLVLRPDQLGDMVTSIPAMRRLRELLPHSRLVGLLTASNAEFAATLGLFDEIIVVDYPDDLLDRKRTMPLQEQEKLRQKLAAYEFGLAVDLSEASQSRPLLLLSGARFLYGFYDRDFPWLNAGFEGGTRDPRNDREVTPHSTRVLAFVERLGVLLRSGAQVIRRTDLTRDRLASTYGIAATDRYAVLHTGARVAFSRWAHFAELAALLVERTDLKVILIPADNPTIRDRLAPGLLASPRFRLVEGRLPWDDFDALISFATVYVGNDSGPKHLASLRGVPATSIHCPRIPWNEWGQELTGSIVSRKVPCAGCGVYFDPDECGQDFACVTQIGLEEVFAAVKAQIQP